MITAATNMQKPFPLDDKFFDALKFLRPEIALNLNKPSDLKSLETLWTQFKSVESIDGSKIDREWKNMQLTSLMIYEKNHI